MDDSQIRLTVEAFDTPNSSAREAAWIELRPLGAQVIPYFVEYFPRFKKAHGRIALIFYATGFARLSEGAFSLGISALNDRASLVRYRACGLCAYSLKNEALPYLQELLNHRDDKTVADAKAAIDAIVCGNHNYFVDRTHSGKIFWQVNREDALV